MVITKEDRVRDVSVKDLHDVHPVVGEATASAARTIGRDLKDAREGEVSVNGDLGNCDRHLSYFYISGCVVCLFVKK